MAFGITEPGIDFDQARLFVFDHQPGVKNTDIGCPARFHFRDDRFDDFIHAALAHNVGENGGGGIGTHPASVRTGVSIKGALVILSGDEWQHILAIAKGKETCLLPMHKFFNDDLGAGLAKAPREQLINRLVCLGKRLREDDAFAGSQPIGFDDIGRFLLTQK